MKTRIGTTQNYDQLNMMMPCFDKRVVTLATLMYGLYFIFFAFVGSNNL
jgi:hypothetical protein